MPLKSRVFSSQSNLVFFLLIAVAFTAGPAFGQLTSIQVTAPAAQSVTCPAGAPRFRQRLHVCQPDAWL